MSRSFTTLALGGATLAALGAIAANRPWPSGGSPAHATPSAAVEARATSANEEALFKPIGGVEGVNPTFDASRRPAQVVAALGLVPGQRVADVGAGRGYFPPRLSAAVGVGGRVVATDVDDDALDALRLDAARLPNVSVRKVAADDPGLEPASYDLILLSEVDHFLADRVAFLRRLRDALAPGGRLAVTHVRALRAPLVAAAAQARLSIVGELGGLPAHYLLFFRPRE